MNLSGDKKNFAVEYTITCKVNTLMGYGKIWFGGNWLGTSEDFIFISYITQGLDQIANSKTLDFKEGLSYETIFNTLNKRLGNIDDDEVHDYLIMMGTFTDDYTIFSFQKDDEITILWKLRSNNTPFSDLNNQSKEIHHFKINRDEYIQRLAKIKSDLSHNLES